MELVVVVGRRAYQVSEQDALSYVAGYSVGQDVSERIVQMAATPPQFSLGNPCPASDRPGPYLVTLDEFDDPNDLELGYAIDGEQVQLSRTSNLVFSVPSLIAELRAALPLLPGDIIFTGTPSGVGLGRNPQRWLQPGEDSSATSKASASSVTGVVPSTSLACSSRLGLRIHDRVRRSSVPAPGCGLAAVDPAAAVQLRRAGLAGRVP